MDTDIVFKQESYKIIGACFEVFKEKIRSFLESFYQVSTMNQFVSRIWRIS
jgi:hypothetical protein